MFKMNKRTKIGAYTAIMSAVVLAALVLLNLIVLSAPSKYTKLDSTEKKLYSLSETSIEAISKIDEDVNIYLLCPGGKDNSGDAVNNLPSLSVFAERYSDLNDHINFEMIDPVEDPSFSDKYKIESLSDYTVIIESDKRYKVIPFDEFYYYYGDGFGKIPSSQYETFVNYVYYYTGSFPDLELCFDGESIITSALDYVLTDKIPHLYALEGHGEGSLSAALIEAIETDNMTFSTLSLLTSEIPEDAAGIIISAPGTDINENEAEMLSEYLAGGGKLILTTVYSYLRLPNLMGVLDDYGLSPIEGQIVEGDGNMHYYVSSLYLLPAVNGDSPLVAPLSGSTAMLIPYAHGINTVSGKENLTVTPLFTTSDKAYLVPHGATSYEKTDESVTGPFDVAVHMKDSSSGAEIVWVASPAFSDDVSSITNGGNQKYFISILGGIIERERIVYNIPADTAGASYLIVNEAQASVWSAVFVVLIPLAFAIAGVAAWLSRRRK